MITITINNHNNSNTNNNDNAPRGAAGGPCEDCGVVDPEGQPEAWLKSYDI